jgi:hypothetical protein
MSVVAFERKQDSGEWSERELSTIVAALSAALAPPTGRDWETGMTENGDAQFYLLLDEKLEPVLTETEELPVQFAPQFAAFA